MTAEDLRDDLLIAEKARSSTSDGHSSTKAGNRSNLAANNQISKDAVHNELNWEKWFDRVPERTWLVETIILDNHKLISKA